MFTGIIQDIGRVRSRRDIDGGLQLDIATALDTKNWQLGDSVAVNGCCLTLTELERATGTFSVQLSGETLRRTALAALTSETCVNIEPALRAGDPLGGHIVTGHVDGTVEVISIATRGEFREIVLSLPSEYAPHIVSKGSVALDGVSLTVNMVATDSFSICLIPHTLQRTTLGTWREGSPVNLEIDILARHVARQLQWLHPSDTTEGGSHAGQL